MLEQDFRKIDLNLLVVLKSLLATSSVGQTAKRLGMSQPATSRALAALRELFGDPLFVKSGAKMRPTLRALELRTPLEDVLSGILRVIEPPAEFDPASSRRRFRIAGTDYSATVILPLLAGRLFHEAPHAELDILPLGASTFDELGSSDLDLVFYSDNPVPSSLMAAEIYRERFACVVRSAHPIAAVGGRMSLDDYVRFAHILVTVTGGRTGPVDRELAALGLERRIAMVLPYFATAALVANTTDFILTMPRRAAQPLAEATGLTLMDPPIELGEFGFRMVWHERVHHDPAHMWLRRTIAAVMRSDPQRGTAPG